MGHQYGHRFFVLGRQHERRDVTGTCKHAISSHFGLLEQKTMFAWKQISNPGGLVWYTNMAAFSLFWNTNMAAVMSRETLYWLCLICPYSWIEKYAMNEKRWRYVVFYNTSNEKRVLAQKLLVGQQVRCLVNLDFVTETRGTDNHANRQQWWCARKAWIWYSGAQTRDSHS